MIVREKTADIVDAEGERRKNRRARFGMDITVVC